MLTTTLVRTLILLGLPRQRATALVNVTFDRMKWEEWLTVIQSDWVVFIYSATSKEMKNLEELRKEIKEQGELRKTSGTYHFHLFLKNQLTVTFDYALHAFAVPTPGNHSQELRRSCLRNWSQRQRKEGFYMCFAAPTSQCWPLKHSFFFSQETLLGCYQVLF